MAVLQSSGRRTANVGEAVQRGGLGPLPAPWGWERSRGADRKIVHAWAGAVEAARVGAAAATRRCSKCLAVAERRDRSEASSRLLSACGVRSCWISEAFEPWQPTDLR